MIQRIIFTIFLATFIGISAQNIGKDSLKEIEEVVIKSKMTTYKKKKENPAYGILQEVWKHKKTNILDKYQTYQYDEYEKIEFALNNIDSSFIKKKIFNKVDFIFNYADSTANGKLALPIFLNEAIYKIYGQNTPEKKKSRQIIAQKTSGFQDNEIVALTAKNLFKEFDIYDNTINFFNIGFQSPISTDGFSTYNYTLLGNSILGGENCYRIQYEPKRKDVLAFKGFIYISKDTYSVVKITLRSTHKINVNFVNGMSAELDFFNPDQDNFFPYRSYMEFDLSILGKNKNNKGITTKRTIVYSNHQFNSPIKNEVFSIKEPKSVSELTQDNEYWNNARTDSLSSSEAGIYDMLEKLEKVPKFNNMIKALDVLGTGYYNIGNAIDIGNLYSSFGFNDVEGTRVRLGARTYFSQNDMWRVQGYGAYGFKDRKFKYGIETKYMLNKTNRFTIGIGTRRDIIQRGVDLTEDDGIMSRSFASSAIFTRGNNINLSNINQTNIFASIEPIKNFQIRVDGSVQRISSANPKHFNLHYYLDNKTKNIVNDSHITLSLIARPGAKYSKIGVDRREHSTLSPTFLLKYTRGIEGLINGDFGYNKLQFMYTQPILVGTWGKSIITIEAGKNFEALPLALQNIIPGNQSYSLEKNTFSQLNYYEFVADSYATMHLEHHFNGKILSYIPLIKKLKLREVAIFRAATGSLSDASKNMNVEKIYSAPDQQIYYEYGFGIENIGLGNFRIFRVDFNWRGNYLHKPNASKFGIKAGIQMNF